MATYRANNVEFARLMLSNMVGDHIKTEAERLRAHLQATAPRGKDPEKTSRYADNFKVETGLDILRQDRVAAFIYNDSRYATALEVGSWNIRNPPAPMTNVLSAFPD